MSDGPQEIGCLKDLVHLSVKLLPANVKSVNPVVLAELKGLFSYDEGSF
jgi:hypothetical protein